MSYQQYFDHYAEPEVKQIHNFPQRYYDQVLCIPVFDEEPDFLQSIQSSARHYGGKVLLILIINQKESSTYNNRNIELVRFIEKYICVWKSSCGIQLIEFSPFDILLIDRFSHEKKIPDKLGVGLARKIACDIAAYLFFKKIISTHQMFCSDADVIFPKDYFSAKLDKNCSAATLSFKHIGNNKFTDTAVAIKDATQLYEKSLYHYFHGLKYANSNYAFPTIGSCLLLNIEYYIKARGFPKRPAAEDFYLLNKLRKLAPIQVLEQPQIHILSRLSDRVPFGTGPAVSKLLNSAPETSLDESPIFYHPQCFLILKSWINYLNYRVLKNDDVAIINLSTEEILYVKELADFFQLETQLQTLFVNYAQYETRKMHIHHWFDGFKTLKTVHYLRDNHFPSISYKALTDSDLMNG